MRCKLPIGIQTFSLIREEGHCYVDKTPLIARMVDEGKYYFLSRPRRFGKSLLISTLADAFAGNRALFDGLHLAGHWDWSRKSPVIRIDLGEGIMRGRGELETTIRTGLRECAVGYGLALEDAEPRLMLRELIQTS